MDKQPDMNFVDRFLYKLLIGAFLLLFTVFLGKIEIINFRVFQTEMKQHFNILKVLGALNGRNNFLLPFDINDEVSGEVYGVFHDSEPISEGRRVNVGAFQGVTVYKTGIVVEVKRNSDKTYCLKVKGIDEYDYIYDKLQSISCNIYKIVKSGEVIGSPSQSADGDYFEFYVYEKDEPVNVFFGQ